MHVVPPEPVVVDFGVAPTVMHPPSADAVKADEARLLELQESLTRHGVEATTRQLESASLETVLSECAKVEADLIIVGSHGHGALYNLLIGSVTADVLKRAKCPVLVVPASAE
jgi:nucleotide-binding universal stress UspA family protein